MDCRIHRLAEDVIASLVPGFRPAHLFHCERNRHLRIFSKSLQSEHFFGV